MTQELQLLIPVIIGSVAVPAINGVKKLINSTDPRINLLIAAVISIFLAVAALALTGAFATGPTSLTTIVAWVGTVFSVATLIYKGASSPSQ